ncbi:hypothetical protein IMZ11_24800 [Microtetraspora sp. AC03309]|uniref:hypothetical protein n=1 Tax=Microtetraspora sp. AC03309 TaxID=2779376 RepID=UPI001E3862DB|nr:hypothetical protein [Microtetraspora sp. AC03309]MCC5578850.1 hypothetical protein [Microtetraspora sp. AC03309]
MRRRALATTAFLATLALTFGGVAEAATAAKATGKVGKDPGPAGQAQCDALAVSIDLFDNAAAGSKDPAEVKRYLTSAGTVRTVGKWRGCTFTTSGSGSSARTVATATGVSIGDLRAATQAECEAFAGVLDNLEDGKAAVKEEWAKELIAQAWSTVFFTGQAMGCSFGSA